MGGRKGQCYSAGWSEGEGTLYHSRGGKALLRHLEMVGDTALSAMQALPTKGAACGSGQCLWAKGAGSSPSSPGEGPVPSLPIARASGDLCSTSRLAPGYAGPRVTPSPTQSRGHLTSAS